jgi:predicted DNA binding CopG/RHH family protein
MSKIKKSAFKPMDTEEAELMRIEQNDQLTSLKGKKLQQMKSLLIEAASNKSAQRKLISLRIREDDLESLRSEAEKKGLRYQSLINSILHQYVSGHLKAS